VALIRQHWDIENKLHWSLDVSSMKTAAVSGRSMPLNMWWLCGTWLSICCVKSTHIR